MKPATAAYEIPRGTTLGKYEILRKIATGGMAEIYLACVRGQAGFEKVVVLKRILPHFAADPKFVQMFLDEARLAATLRHPNIGDVYDVGEVDGTLFFTMEYIHGQDVCSIRVAARKRNERIPLAVALAIVQGTAAALQCAHEKTSADGRPLGLVHRDVSASNVLVSYDGAIKLLDFGIARANDREHKTQTGTLKGKAPYMSPEQCRGQRLDRRSDLFSLGVMMFELTVGRRPFRGDNDFTIMEQIVHGAPPAPSSIIAGYPPELEAIVGKLLAREPAARYATAEDMLQDLEPALARHQLWASTHSVRKYMRVVFADRVDAWERAANEGVPFEDYVGEAITSPSRKSPLVTPPSAFPAVTATEPSSARLAVAPAPTSQEFPAAAEPSSVSAVSSTVAPSKTPVVYPELRSSRRAAVPVLAGLLVGGAGIAGFYFWPKHAEPAEVRGGLDPARQGTPARRTDLPNRRSNEEPAIARPSPAPPAPPPPAEPRVELTPPAPAPPPAPEPSPTTIAPPILPAPAPAAKPPPKHVVPPRLPARTPPKKSDGAPDKPEKEKGWDPNSPFLPPSS